MPQIERSALVFFSAQQMFDLVNDVSRYPEFLPGCKAARILRQSEAEMEAELELGKAGLGKSFTTLNELQAPHRIGMTLVNGPFKKLQGGWTFTELQSNACKVELKLEFEFSSRLVELAFGKIFKELTAAMVNAFTERARQIYGAPNV